MKVLCATMDSQVAFILADLEPGLHQAALDLHYQATADGFAKYYPADTPHLDRVFLNLEQHAGAMLQQKAGLRPVPWQKALLAFLQVVEGENLTWWLRGSAALAMRGLDIAQGDIDLTTDDAGAHRLGALLLDCLVEPVIPVHNWFCNWWGRAFWDVRIEWMGGVNETADRPEVGDFGPQAEQRAETLTWHGYEILVPPLDLQIAVTERRGLAERAALIRQATMSADRTHTHRDPHSPIPNPQSPIPSTREELIMTLSPSLDRRHLDALIDRLNNTASVVTTAYEGQVAGCFVTFVTDCSLEPPRLLVKTSHENLTHELVEKSGVMAVHLMPRGREEWIRHFGYQSGRDVDKFANLDWKPGVTGSPILSRALGHVEGRVLNSMDCGDHTAQLLEPVAATLPDFNAVPLTTFEILARGLEEPRVPPAQPWTGYNSEK